MKNNPVCRKGTVEDIASFLDCFTRSIPILFPKYTPQTINCILEIDYGPNWLTERITKGGKDIYLSWLDGQIIGYLLATKVFAGVAFADWLAIEKPYQKQGIGTQLLSLWEKDSLEKGAHALQLWTAKKTVPFYEKCGFINGGVFPQAWYGEDSYLIYKSLRKPKEENYLRSYLQKI